MMWLRNRGWRGTNITDFVLLAVFIVLAYIFLVRRSGMSKVDQVLKENDSKASFKDTQFDINSRKLVPDKADQHRTKDENEQEVIKSKVKNVPDSRSDECKKNSRGEIPASIIIDYFDYSFYDMKVTLESVRLYTTESLIREIIIVDDGTTLDYIKAHAKEYLDKLPKAVILRNEERQGQAKARMRAAREAMGANLIFIDQTVVVSPGWIEPLVDYVQKKPKVIALPHYDRINDPVTYDYIRTEIQSATSFTWSLEMKMTKSKDSKGNDKEFPSATIRGNVFAVTKVYFMEIGGLDSGLSEGGGDALELSFRTWLCGGSVDIVPCSRVGILNYKDPVKITSNRNKWRLIELWMSDYKGIIHKYLGRNPEDSITQEDRKSIATRKSELNKLTCKKFSWYIDVIARDVYLPPTDAKHHGFLKIQNGHCARVGEDARIDLGSCSPEQHNLLARDLVFAFFNDGQLKWGELCLSVQSSAYILAEQCAAGNDHQIWTYDNKSRLVNKWSGFCAMHVTDPDPKKKDAKRQIVMAQGCDGDKSDKLEFSSWKFLET